MDRITQPNVHLKIVLSRHRIVTEADIIRRCMQGGMSRSNAIPFARRFMQTGLARRNRLQTGIE
jgi:hypothetical protein